MKNQKALNDIETIVKEITSLSKGSLLMFTKMVDDIIISNCKDEKHIETTLDRLLDFCFDDKILVVYKKLCRYYLLINPKATEDYVNFYREMYDNN